jgi:hypothetical protein
MLRDTYILRTDLKKTFLKFMIIAVALLLLVSFQATGDATTAPPKQAAAPSLEEKWGIKVIWVMHTAAGYMIEFRYRVTDKEKAAPLFKRQTKPYLLDLETGTKLKVHRSQKVGSMRTSVPPHADRNYFMLFGNLGSVVKPGNRVTVVIGDFRVENLVVR